MYIVHVTDKWFVYCRVCYGSQDKLVLILDSTQVELVYFALHKHSMCLIDAHFKYAI